MEEKKKKKKEKPKQKFPLGSLGKKNVPFILALVVIQSIMLWVFFFVFLLYFFGFLSP